MTVARLEWSGESSALTGPEILASVGAESAIGHQRVENLSALPRFEVEETRRLGHGQPQPRHLAVLSTYSFMKGVAHARRLSNRRAGALAHISDICDDICDPRIQFRCERFPNCSKNRLRRRAETAARTPPQGTRGARIAAPSDALAGRDCLEHAAGMLDAAFIAGAQMRNTTGEPR
jgi:hypothetical protein